MNDAIVTVATFLTIPPAEACRLRLEAEGLTVYLTDAETIRTDWLLSNAVGSIKVQVPAAQYESAMQLLEQVKQRHDEQSLNSDKDYCLSCGAELPEDDSDCPACGWSYGSPEEEELEAMSDEDE